uniref:AlNc14C234G9346 protein n=1 Tax=Albugo laibachii Nc14 TaxID=890382 RepID=F0WSK1_9STRA|nr:AlNc14C234G9346 [Albugo laibachii Nc14]|eukprot:CCA24327.1 AlNc14C234G9346 [Albugo laibachii Nc14]
MNRVLEVYNRQITVEQATRLMRARKPVDRSWTEKYQVLVAVASSANCLDRFVLRYIYEGTTTEIKRAMQTRLERRRTDHLKQAWGMSDFAATFEHDISASVVSAGRQPTGPQKNFRISYSSANVPAHGEWRRC